MGGGGAEGRAEDVLCRGEESDQEGFCRDWLFGSISAKLKNEGFFVSVRLRFWPLCMMDNWRHAFFHFHVVPSFLPSSEV